MDELVLANGRKQTVVKCYLYFHIIMIRNNMLIYILIILITKIIKIKT